MKKVDFNKLQAGDLVKVPRTQFAPMRSGWNGWLFSEAVVIRKGVGRKSKRNVVVVEMRTPAGMDGGACLGFSHDGDDEPIERCKRCIACTSFDWDEEKKG